MSEVSSDFTTSVPGGEELPAVVIKNTFLHFHQDSAEETKTSRRRCASWSGAGDASPSASSAASTAAPSESGLELPAPDQSLDIEPFWTDFNQDEIWSESQSSQTGWGMQQWYWPTAFGVEVDASTTTLTIRKVPEEFDPPSLLGFIWESGFAGTVDFFYLPMDFRRCRNVGYAFVNFSSPEFAAAFQQQMNGRVLLDLPGAEAVEVCPARIQGLHKNVEHFRNSAVRSACVLPEHQPMLLDPVTGTRLPFPAPTPKARRRPLRRARALAVCAA
eukprot:CAMPEP_0204254796 /NCGR_PEP_ID=MMETSP0468-20130131/2787_1 /ASSEMBLY_ACC=CAM_ASM_000383 /TAXON_ID=2969 /ORGANISM="Oxyrrhis marina" /LENGTH=273 /DNA_ID=CAMNT_0051228587 /DNA_START=69 /DNA_END=890 /DNA_ORIENTATION=+